MLPLLPLRDALPLRSLPVTNYGLITANVAIFVFRLLAVPAHEDEISGLWTLVPARLVTDPAHALPTLITSAFVHLSLGQLIGNMLFLWIFGDNVEDAMGHGRYLLFYLSGAVCGNVAQVLASPMSAIPMAGAAGSVCAVLTAYLLLYPMSSITVLNPIIILWLFWGFVVYVPAWIVIGQFFIVDLWSSFLDSHPHAGVAGLPNIGGGLAGAALWGFFMLGQVRVDYPRWTHWIRRRGLSPSPTQGRTPRAGKGASGL